MKYINWKNEYKVNIYIIDKQHQQLFSIYNSILDDYFDKNNLKKDLNKLENYVFYHFIIEEKIYKMFGIPHKKHTEEHSKISIFVKVLNDKYQHHGLSIKDIIQLRKWLKYHVIVEDMLIFKLLKIRNMTTKKKLLLNIKIIYFYILLSLGINKL